MSTQQALNFGKLPPSARKGMKKARTNANPILWALMQNAILSVAQRQRELNADDVLEEIERDGTKLFDVNALGPAMTQAKQDGILEWTPGMVRSKREGKNGNVRRVWRSLRYRG